MAKLSLSTILSGFQTVAQLNQNFTDIIAEFQSKVLYRDNPAGEPNSMQNDLDMNSNDIANVNEANVQSLSIAGEYVYPSTLTPVNADTVVFTPTGDISATDAQAAIEELDSEKQPLDAGLTSISGLTTAADKMVYTTAIDTYAVADLTAFGRSMLDDADATTVRSTLGLGSSAVEDVGTTIGDVVQLGDVGGSAGLPAVDGSQLIGVTTDSSSAVSTITPTSDADVTLSAVENAADVRVLETGSWTQGWSLIGDDADREFTVINNSGFTAAITTDGTTPTTVAVPSDGNPYNLQTRLGVGVESAFPITLPNGSVVTAMLESGEQMTTSNVLAQTAGAAVGAVGTYAFLLALDGATNAPGDTLGGASLLFAGINDNDSGVIDVGGTSTPAVVGTWRCMGYSIGGPTASNNSTTLWLRIS